MSRLALVATALGAVLLAACGRPAPLTVAELRMPAEQDPAILRIDDRSVYTDPGGETEDVAARALRAIGVTSTAYYKYHLKSGDGSETLKVKINVYRDRDAALRNWPQRYPESLARHGRPADFGDPSLAVGERMVAFVEGNVLVEITGEPGSSKVADFARRYHAFVQQKLRRRR